MLGSRALEGMCTYYERKEFPILAYGDPIAYLWMQQVHEEDHTGITRTTAKSRRRFWIVRGRDLARKIKKSCYTCRRRDKELAQQQMAPLPKSRQSMTPTFHEVSMDLFGPYIIKDAVKKRTRMKVYGVVINCMSTRALHIDIAEDYSADAVQQVLIKFMALRGCPSVIHSDKGSQLEATANELKTWAVAHKIKWYVAPAEGQHRNGASEALIKSIKQTLSHVIGETVLTFAGLQTVFYEVANIVNSRPIGIVSGSDPVQPSPITPNHLLLGRATSEAVEVPLENTSSTNKRLRFLHTLVNDWWRRWYENVLPSLVPSYKWHHQHRNVQVGDICLIKYENEIRAHYKLGRVIGVKVSADGLVRMVTLTYRNPNEKQNREVDRPIQGIAVIVPIEEQEITSTLNPDAGEFQPLER